MKLTEFCIKRPVFTTVLSLILIVIGIIGYSRLSVRELPNIERPVVTISTQYPGASANLVETQITTPLEEAVSSVSGFDLMRSQSKQGNSRISIRFNYGHDINDAANDVRNKIAQVIKSFPIGVEQPIVTRADPDAIETVILSVTDSKLTPLALSDYVDRYIKPQIEQVTGVANVEMFGAQNYAMRVWLNPVKMAVRKVTVPDVISALKNQNINVPGGQIESSQRYYSVLTDTNLTTVKAFDRLIIRDDNGYLVRISDIGKAQIGPENVDTSMRINGKPAVGLGVISQAEANPIEVASQTVARVKMLQENLPPSMHLEIAYNNANYVNQSMHNVYSAVVEAIILVLLVVLLFLGSIRSTLIPVVTIPICLISVFAFIYFMGYSINFVSLLAVVLAIGLVVDDAIVMLENVYRHIENGMPRFDAAIKGSSEIAFAIVAMTITLAAVYAPIGFAQGMTGIIFRQFAFTLAMAVVISGFVALTLSPMMCARLLPKTNKKGKYQLWFNTGFQRLQNYYQGSLAKCLNWRFVIIVLLVIIAMSGYLLYENLPKEIAPTEDTGSFMTIVHGPTNASFAYTERYANIVEKLFAKIPQLKTYMMMVGFRSPARAFSWLILKPWSERDKSQQQITQDFNKQLKKIPGIRAYTITPSAFGGHNRSGGNVRLVLMSTESYPQLYALSQHFVQLINEYPGLTDVESDLKMDSQEFSIHVNRNLAAALGVNMADIGNTIATMLGGTKASTFQFGDYDYNVMVQMRRDKRRDLNVIKQLYVQNDKGTMIPLSSLVTIKATVGPLELPHFNRMRSTIISAQLTNGYSLGDAVSFLQTLAKNNLPRDAKYAFYGSAKQLLDSKSTMLFAFMLAIVFIYLVLAAQFESFVDPFIILFSVPLSIVGALVALKLTGKSLNIYSEIGLVTLIGLVTKHGILITEFANQLRRQGLAMRDAIIKSASLRLRPILMTTAAMVIGALPLALASGAGANGRQAIGWVIVGGMLFGTFFSLFVVPVAYSLLSRKVVLDHKISEVSQSSFSEGER